MAHGHESADKHHNGHDEWIGRKTREGLKVAGLNMFLDELPKMPQAEFEALHDEIWEDYFRSVA